MNPQPMMMVTNILIVVMLNVYVYLVTCSNDFVFFFVSRKTVTLQNDNRLDISFMSPLYMINLDSLATDQDMFFYFLLCHNRNFGEKPKT